MFTLGFYYEREEILSKINLNIVRRASLLRNLPLLVLLVATLLLSSSMITGLSGSSNGDAAFHTLIVRTLLVNPSAVSQGSMLPYANSINSYPPGAHILSAFLLVILSVPIEKIIVLSSAMVPVLTILSFYTTTGLLFRNKVLSTLSAFVCFFSASDFYMGPLAFGDLPLLLSFYVCTSFVGLAYVLFEKRGATVFDWFLIALIFFMAIETYPAGLLFISLCSILLISIKLIGKLRQRFSKIREWILRRSNLETILAISLPILCSLPYLNLVYHTTSWSQQNLPADVNFNVLYSGQSFLIDLIRGRVTFDWLLDIPTLWNKLSLFGILIPLASLSLPLLVLIWLGRLRQVLPSETRRIDRVLLLLYALLVLLMAYLTLSTNLILWTTNFFDPERVWEHIFIVGVILVAVILYYSGYALRLIFGSFRIVRRVPKRKQRMKSGNVVKTVLILCLITGSSLIATYYLTVNLAGHVDNSASILRSDSTVGPDDVLLMTWIKGNTPSDAVFLVSQSDSGEYLTAVTQRISIYGYDNEIYSARYAWLVSDLSLDPYDPNIVPSLLYYNISYIYIGSVALNNSASSPYDAHFNPILLQSIPYFVLVKRIGGAWLFQFEIQNVPS
jgi:hypothetical protein